MQNTIKKFLQQKPYKSNHTVPKYVHAQPQVNWLEKLSEGAVNHPLRDWASQEDMLKNIQTKIKDQSGKDIEIDLNACLEHSIKLGSNKIKALNTKQTVPFLLNIKETNFDAADIDIDTKIDLVCVIDISGSMGGEKINYVRKTMVNLLEVLQGHRLAIVLFDDIAELYMNFKIINEENYANIKLGIDKIDSRNSTNITAGISMAQHLIGLRETKNNVSSIFLLSDGSHNCGAISKEILFDGDIKKTKCEYTLTSFGYGDDHDAVLLQMMSEEKGGNYYFVNDITKVGECFLDCLGMVTSILGQNLVAKIKLLPNEVWPEIRFSKTFGNYWTTISSVETEVKINSFYAGINKNFIAQIELDPVAVGKVTSEKEIFIAQCLIEIQTLGAFSKSVYFNSELKIKVLPNDSQEDVVEEVEVQKQFTRVKGAEIIKQANELENQHNWEEAERVITEFQGDLVKYSDDALFNQMGEALKEQKVMINNNKTGKANAFKSCNVAMQQQNVYMNEQSAPLFSKSLYANKKSNKMNSKY